MKQLIILILFIIAFIHSNAQSSLKLNEANSSSPTTQNQESIVYKLFPTQNMWTFIKLNTRNGRMWQVQYDINGNNRFESQLNLLALASEGKGKNGRFT